MERTDSPEENRSAPATIAVHALGFRALRLRRTLSPSSQTENFSWVRYASTRLEQFEVANTNYEVATCAAPGT